LNPTPVLGTRALSSTLAWRQGQPISAGLFLAEASALAERLPAQGQPVNLCEDRYLFAVAWVAALLRGQLSLMPPNALTATLRHLRRPGPAPYALVDDLSLDCGGMQVLPVTRPSGLAPLQLQPVLAPDLQAVCLLTSGSTGVPQPHVRRWRALTASIEAEVECLARWLQWPSLDGLNLVATVPAQHSYGFESSVLLALLGGAALDAGRPFYPADIADALERLPRPRGLVSTPFHLKTLLNSGVALPPTDLLLSATAPLSPQLAAQAEQRFDARLVEIYGCTEAGQVAARRTTEGEVWTTLGALRLHLQDGPEGGRAWVQGGHVEQATPLADVLELVDAQRFRLLGRSNDLIHVAGKRSSLAHLDFHLNRIEGIRDGAFWLPDAAQDGVARLVAFVVAPGLHKRAIVEALRPNIDPAFLPRQVIQVAALPRAATGKLTAQALREFALRTIKPASRPRREP
jgi:acyl-coenzyme A synthetase/AMP-(fatty) acid ligase